MDIEDEDADEEAVVQHVGAPLTFLEDAGENQGEWIVKEAAPRCERRDSDERSDGYPSDDQEVNDFGVNKNKLFIT